MNKSLPINLNKTLFISILLVIGSAVHAQITSWTFEPFLGTVANPLPNIGAGSASIINLGGGSVTPGARTGMSGTGCGPQSGVSAWAFEPFDPGSINESNGAEFKASTAGYQNISFTWDQRWSNTVANTVRIQYTTDGSTWVPFTMTAGNTTFCNGSINGNGCFEANTTGDEYRRITVNFSSMSAVNNNPNFGVRLLASHYQGTGEFRQVSTPTLVANPGGTWRFDNISFTGTLIPGPTASVITAVAPTSICTGATANLRVTITGGAGPFTVVYSNGVTTFTVNNYVSGTNITISPTATRTYSIVSVTNANGAVGTGNSGSPSITVNPLPAVPTATNLATCLTGAFTMTGGSAPPLGHTGSYSSGNPYSGPTTTFTYTITNTVTGCSRSSSTYTFTRNTAPSISVQPTPAGAQTVCQGQPFLPITVTAAASGISYSWRRNTVASTVGATTLPLTNSATYTPLSNFVGIVPGQAYYYYVVVSGTCTPAVISSFAGPFVAQPAAVGGTASGNQTVCSNAPSDLTVTGFTTSISKWQYATDFAFTTPVDIPSSASSTLTSAQMGILSATRYYRAVAVNGTCEAFSNVITVTYDTTTWDGIGWTNGAPTSSSAVIFTGNYSSSADLHACSVTVNSGNVVFNSNHNLIIQNGLNVSGGTLTFENNASLVQVNNAMNSGNITYKRSSTPMRKFDYTYWSSPVDNQILANFSPLTLSDKYFWFDTTFYSWQAVTAPALTPMDIGKGYIIRAPQNFDPVTTAVFDGIFIGKPNNGDYSINIVKTGGNDLNCIGNPYPSAISAKKFIEENTAAFGAVNPGTTLYFWTHNTAITNNVYTFDDYATYNFTGGAGTGTSAAGINNAIPNGMIAAGQAFMVKGVIEGTTTATFTNAMREIGNNTQFFRLQQFDDLARNRVWLELKNNQGAYKQILVGYIENATDGLDNGFDGEVLEAGNSVSFYSLLGAKKLAIQGKSLTFDAQDQIALGFKTGGGAFEISLSDFDGFFGTQDIYLEDRLLGVVHNLKNSAYSFVTETGIINTRFVLRFSDSSLGISNPSQVQNTVIIYKNSGDQIVLNSGVKKMKNIRIFDPLGRLLFEHKNLDVNQFISTQDLDDLILFSIELSDGQIISKKYSN